jgi:hypothetical protein
MIDILQLTMQWSFIEYKKHRMNIHLLIFGAVIIYVLDIFVLIWLSGRFAGIHPLPIRDIGILGLAIILLSWLIGTAIYNVPLILKPFMILLAMVAIIYFFILILDTHFLKAIAAGLFYLLCQVVLIIVLLRELWSKDFFRLVRYILFNSY